MERNFSLNFHWQFSNYKKAKKKRKSEKEKSVKQNYLFLRFYIRGGSSVRGLSEGSFCEFK